MTTGLAGLLIWQTWKIYVIGAPGQKPPPTMITIPTELELRRLFQALHQTDVEVLVFFACNFPSAGSIMRGYSAACRGATTGVDPNLDRSRSSAGTQTHCNSGEGVRGLAPLPVYHFNDWRGLALSCDNTPIFKSLIPPILAGFYGRHRGASPVSIGDFVRIGSLT